MAHGIDCKCLSCYEIKKLLRTAHNSGKIYVSGAPEDKKKLGIK